ncbi:MAG: hypothetical protein WC307_06470 [Candidatus Nanoarchaeia archaeon]|jgi:hypothetical protein
MLTTNFTVRVVTTQEDFCASDLTEAIKTGIEDVGNYNLIELSVNEVLD